MPMPRNILPGYLSGSVSPQPQSPGLLSSLLAERNAPIYAGLLNAGGALLQAGGPSTSPTSATQAFGAGLQGFGQGMQQAKAQQQQDQMFQLQYGQLQQQLQRKKALEAAHKNYVEGKGPEIKGLSREVASQMDPVTFGKTAQSAYQNAIKVQQDLDAYVQKLPYEQQQELFKMGVQVQGAKLKEEATAGIKRGNAAYSAQAQADANFQAKYRPVDLGDGRQVPAFMAEIILKEGVTGPRKQTELAQSLRKEFQQHPAVQLWNQAEPVIKTAREAVNRDTPQADLNLVYAFAKIMDPGSVVREGEQDMIVGSGPIADQAKALLSRVAGGAKLSKEVRKGLLTEMESRMKQFNDGYVKTSQAFEAEAVNAGIDPKRLLLLQTSKPASSTPLSDMFKKSDKSGAW